MLDRMNFLSNTEMCKRAIYTTSSSKLGGKKKSMNKKINYHLTEWVNQALSASQVSAASWAMWYISGHLQLRF